MHAKGHAGHWASPGSSAGNKLKQQSAGLPQLHTHRPCPPRYCNSAAPAALNCCPVPSHRLWPSMAACSTAVVSTSRSLAQCT